MVRHYYTDQVTDFSEQELQSIFRAANPPVCLLGGWAVHFHVTEGFEQEHGRSYIGSRDIDIGLHIEPSATVDELEDGSVGSTLSNIEARGYTKSRFGFVQTRVRETGETITEEQESDYAMHELFKLYIDVIPDTSGLDAFEEAFGFRPPDEPLLKPVFEDGVGEPLAQYVSWDVSDDISIAPVELLAAMKIRAVPTRDKTHKRVKDLADLHALLWYGGNISQVTENVEDYITEQEMKQFEAVLEPDLFENTATLLQIDQELLQGSINQLRI